MGAEIMPLGDVVYKAWVTLFKNAKFQRKYILRAMSDGSLPAWFELRSRNFGQAPLSPFTKALIDGNHWKDIDWSRKVLKRLMHTPTGLVGEDGKKPKSEGEEAAELDDLDGEEEL